MDKEKMKTNIGWLILGVIIALFCVHAYTVYQLRKQVIINSQVIQQIASFLNQKLPTN